MKFTHCGVHSVTQLELAELHIAVGGHDVECSMVFSSKLEHVIHRIPVSGYIMQNHAWLEAEGLKNLVPSREDDGQGIFDGQRNISKLFKRYC